MAKLFGSVQGNRGEATRLGNGRLVARAQGWDSGVTVEAYADTPELREYVITENGGSNGTAGSFALGKIEQRVADGRVAFVLSSKLATALNVALGLADNDNGAFRGGDVIELKAGWQA